MTVLAAARPSHRHSPSRRWALWLCLAAALIIGVGFALDRWRTSGSAVTLDPATLRPGYGARSFAEAVSLAERNVAAARESLSDQSGEWLRQEALARALIGRYRLTGSFDDLAEADRLLDIALAVAPDPAGPVLTKATLAVMTHRLGAAETVLARANRAVLPDAHERADAAALAGDIQLQRGKLADAKRAFAEAAALSPTSGIRLRMALLAAHSGDIDAGRQQLESLLAQPRQQPSVLAELMLQRANLAYAQGDWDNAGQWIAAARRAFPGYWLADAYAAQQLALEGRTADAVRAYAAVAQRSGRPEVMTALAHLLRLEGLAEPSRRWSARAADAWPLKARRFPEAVLHHQAEHELTVGSVAKARELAHRDASLRPQAPSLILLARAELLQGRPQAARGLLDRAQRQGWVSAGLFLAQSETAAALGDKPGAERALSRAEAINPKAADPRSRLIWFGHD